MIDKGQLALLFDEGCQGQEGDFTSLLPILDERQVRQLTTQELEERIHHIRSQLAQLTPVMEKLASEFQKVLGSVETWERRGVEAHHRLKELQHALLSRDMPYNTAVQKMLRSQSNECRT